MQETIQHEKYGTITYRENAWSGKKEIVFNETLLLKKEKNVYIYKPDENTDVTVKSKGSFLTGVTLDVEGESIKVIPAPKWYEVVCSVLIFMFTVIWGKFCGRQIVRSSIWNLRCTVRMDSLLKAGRHFPVKLNIFPH